MECLRRLLMTSANVFIAHAGLMKQLVINLCTALVSTKLYSYYQPYIQDSDDVLSEMAQWCLIISLLMTLLIYHGVTSDDSGDLNGLGMAFVALQIFFVLFAVVVVILDIRADLREAAEGKDDADTKTDVEVKGGRASFFETLVARGDAKRAHGRKRESVSHVVNTLPSLQMLQEGVEDDRSSTREDSHRMEISQRPARDGRSPSVQPNQICWNGVAIEIPLCS